MPRTSVPTIGEAKTLQDGPLSIFEISRRLLDISVTELAQRAGLTTRTVARVLRGEGLVRSSSRHALAQVLGLSPDQVADPRPVSTVLLVRGLEPEGKEATGGGAGFDLYLKVTGHDDQR